jgi:hypothetical protein
MERSLRVITINISTLKRELCSLKKVEKGTTPTAGGVGSLPAIYFIFDDEKRRLFVSDICVDEIDRVSEIIRDLIPAEVELAKED